MTPSWTRDEHGAFQVVEAILVAVLVATALIFFAVVQRPAPPPSEEGIDLQVVATDALRVIQGPNPGKTGDDQLLELVREVLDQADYSGPPPTPQSNLAAAVDGILPEGMAWVMRLDNGYGALDLASSTPPSTPRSAAAAEAFVTLEYPAQGTGLRPGAALPFTVDGGCGLTGPNGLTSGPGNVLWRDVWRDGANSVTNVPAFAPFGTWTPSGSCGTTPFEVSPGADVDIPMYGIQLVVWNGT